MAVYTTFEHCSARLHFGNRSAMMVETNQGDCVLSGIPTLIGAINATARDRKIGEEHVVSQLPKA
jgi:hypothetical protein